jgi:1-deoxyxylulose-5-phosphate synthase
MMHYTNLGNTNLKVSRFCLGTMMFGAPAPGKPDREASITITHRAIDAGVNFIDTADIYNAGECETILGSALEGRRDQVVLATKAGMKMGDGPNDQGISRFHMVRALEASLQRLKTDRVDLFYVHWPMAAMNLEEMMRTLDDLVRQGKALYAACSNFPAWLLCRSNWVAEVGNYVPLVAGQYPYNLIERGLEVEILPMAQALKVGITIYRPLAIGVLTGKYLDNIPAQTRGVQDERIPTWTNKYRDGIAKLNQFAADRGYTTADAANAWVASHPAVTSTIVGVSRLDQLEANLKGAAWQMTPEERATVTSFFPTEVWEEAGGKFPWWRRTAEIL